MILVRLLVNRRLLAVKFLGSQRLCRDFQVLGVWHLRHTARPSYLRVSEGYLKTLELKRIY